MSCLRPATARLSFKHGLTSSSCFSGRGWAGGQHGAPHRYSAPQNFPQMCHSSHPKQLESRRLQLPAPVGADGMEMALVYPLPPLSPQAKPDT